MTSDSNKDSSRLCESRQESTCPIASQLVMLKGCSWYHWPQVISSMDLSMTDAIIVS